MESWVFLNLPDEGPQQVWRGSMRWDWSDNRHCCLNVCVQDLSNFSFARVVELAQEQNMQYPHTITLSPSYKTASGATYWTWILSFVWVTCTGDLPSYGDNFWPLKCGCSSSVLASCPFSSAEIDLSPVTLGHSSSLAVSPSEWLVWNELRH